LSAGGLCAICGEYKEDAEYCRICGVWLCSECQRRYPARVKAFIEKHLKGYWVDEKGVKRYD
jgi:hypothetical protein